MTQLRALKADALNKLRNSRCQDCNGPTVGSSGVLPGGFVLFLTRHAATCPMWGERAHRHGIGNGDILIHPLGHLNGDEDVLVYLGDVGDEVRRG